jgi:uncharacterized phiE125 gp8 family phage protein
MTTRLITPPLSEPVTLIDAKLHLRVDHGDDDDLIEALIIGAREQCEHIIGRSLLPQVWEKTLDSFPLFEGIELLNPSIISIASIKYIDALTANEATLPDSYYFLDKDSEPGWVIPTSGGIWPVALNIASSVRIRYLAGYEDVASVPVSIKSWIKLAVGTAYDTRAGIGDKASFQLPHDFFSGLLDRHRIWQL